MKKIKVPEGRAPSLVAGAMLSVISDANGVIVIRS